MLWRQSEMKCKKLESAPTCGGGLYCVTIHLHVPGQSTCVTQAPFISSDAWTSLTVTGFFETTEQQARTFSV